MQDLLADRALVDHVLASLFEREVLRLLAFTARGIRASLEVLAEKEGGPPLLRLRVPHVGTYLASGLSQWQASRLVALVPGLGVLSL